MKTKCFLLLIFGFLFLTIACTTKQPVFSSTQTEENDALALQTLADFLDDLHAGSYEEAALLYGGTYETMINHNPTISPEDHAALMQNACTINGAQCLHVSSIALEEKVSNSKFIYRVEFQNADGSLLVVGPCCGDNKSNTQNQSSFLFEVSQNEEGKFLVMTMVPYLP
ncbi:MAG: hypothetical protein AB2L18_06215 [Anaerolineaceae bacterium]